MASIHDDIPGFRKKKRTRKAPKPILGRGSGAPTTTKPRKFGSSRSILGGSLEDGRYTKVRQYGQAGLVAGSGAAMGGEPRVSFADSAFGKQVGKPRDFSPPRSLSVAAMPRPKPTPPPPDPSQYTKTLADFLAQARQILASETQGTLSGIDARAAAAQQSAGQASQQIGGGYKALSSFISGNDPKLAAAFQQAQQQTQGHTDQAVNTIQDASAAAQRQQQAILARLGIEDANIPIAKTGQTIEADMANAAAAAATTGQLANTQLAANSQTERGYNTAMGTSAALEGQGQQNLIQRMLQSRMADLQDQRTQATQGGSEADAYALAMDLMNQDMGVFTGNYERQYGAQRDAMGFAQDLAEQQADQARFAAEQNQTPRLDSTGYRALGPAGQANYALQQSGVDPAQAAVITRAIQEAYASGEIRSAADFARILRENAGINPNNMIDAANAAMIYYQYFA